jgi:tricorn protease-like protein
MERNYTTYRFDNGNDLWVTELRTKETKLLSKLGVRNVNMELSSDGKFILFCPMAKP